MKILIYGFGNPGRKDDGLGVKLAEMIEDWIKGTFIPDVDIETNYQLNVEDAEIISNYDKVIFVDASQDENLTNFILKDVKPEKDKIEFTMHAVSPGYVLYLTQDMFNKYPDTKLLEIKGYAWNIEEGVSSSALLNLERAYQFLVCKIIKWLELEIPKIKC